MTSELAHQNKTVLNLVQALWGLISPDILGVALEFSRDSLVLHVAISNRNEEIEEDIHEIVASFEAMQWPEDIETREKIHVGPANQTWAGRAHRLVFLAKMKETD